MPKYKYELRLLLLALGWMVFVAFFNQLYPGFSAVGDDGTYLDAAAKLYFRHLPHEARPIGIAAIFGLPFLFGLRGVAVVEWGIFVNVVCWIFSVLLVFETLSGRIEKKIAFRFSVLFLLCIGNLAVAFQFLSEPVYIVLLLSAIYFLGKFDLTRNIRHLCFALAILFFAALVKPAALGLGLLVILFYFRSLPSVVKSKNSVYIYISLLLIAVNMSMMKRSYGDYTISYISNITYYNYLGAKADCYRKKIEFQPGKNRRADYFKRFSSHDQQKIVRKDIVEQLQNNTSNLAKAYLYCMYSNSSKGSYIISECTDKKQTAYFDTFHFLFKALSKLQNIFLTIAGILLSFYVWIKRKKADGFQKLLGVTILYIFFLSAMSCFQTDRFHIVFFPLVIMLAAGFLHKKSGTMPA